MANRKTQFLQSVKLILDKADAVKEAEKFQKLLDSTKIDLDSKEFENKVSSIIKKMNKETMKLIATGFNEALTALGKTKNLIKIEDLIDMSNEQIWSNIGQTVGTYVGKGLQEAINNIHFKPEDIPEIKVNVELTAGVEEIEKELEKILEKFEDDLSEAFKIKGVNERNKKIKDVEKSTTEKIFENFNFSDQISKKDIQTILEKAANEGRERNKVRQQILDKTPTFKKSSVSTANIMPDIKREETEVTDDLIKKEKQLREEREKNLKLEKELLELRNKNTNTSPKTAGTKNHFMPYALDIKDAENIVKQKVDQKVLQDWYTNQNHAAREILAKQILEDVDLRNAALNIAWDNYKKSKKVDISFEDFLQTDVSMYRGSNTGKYFSKNKTTSFTSIENIAKQFGENVVAIMIKPIETLGSLIKDKEIDKYKESEFFVQQDAIKDRPEIKEWAGNLIARDEQDFNNKVNQIKTMLQQGRTEDDVRSNMKRAGWDNIDEILTKAKEATVAHSEAMQEANIRQKEYTEAVKEYAEIPVPSEDDIKNGKASWRGMPIKYNASLPNEAQNLTDHMEVGSKFFEAQNQDNILDHEVAHNIADRLMQYMTGTWDKASEIFISNGEGLYGDLGASALSETLAHAVTEYFSDPDAFKARSEDAFNYIEEYLKKSGDTLDNVYSKIGETPIEPQSDDVVADNEKKIKSYEELKGVLQEYHDAVINIKKAEGVEQKQPHVEKFMDLNNLLSEQLEDGDQKSQLSKKLKDISNTRVDEESVASIAQMFGIEIPQAVESVATRAEASLDKLDELSDKAYDETDAEALNKILQERKTILDSIDESVRPDYADEIESQQQINAELEKRLSLLRDAQNGLIDVDDIDDIIKETGTLESKLERLDDVSYDWGMKIKDGEEDDAIDELEAFEEAYDRIILKLANGRNIEILPNAKGLRQLNKYQDGLDHSAYGETEIDDVIFERKKKEVAVQEQLNDAKKEEQQIEQKSDNEVTETQVETVAQAGLNEELKETLDLKNKIEAASESGVHGQTLADIGGKTGSGDVTTDVGIQELQKVLDAITYKVKIVNDDTDKTANKIALDDSTLKTTLQDVFKNIINPTTEQNDGNTREPWALESTLQSVKSVLDSIRTNTATVETATIPDDNVLSAIKTAVESIDNKIAQGTKVIYKENKGDKKPEESTNENKQPIKNPKEDGFTGGKLVDKRIKDLQDLYKKEAELEFRQELDDKDSVRIELGQKRKEIEEKVNELKKEGLGLSETEIKNIKEQVKQNQDNLLEIEKAKEAEAQAAKNQKAALKAQMSDMRDKSRISKASSTWRSGTDLYNLTASMFDESDDMSLEDIIDLPQMQALSEALNYLEKKKKIVNNLIAKGDQLSEEEKIARDNATKSLKEQTAATQLQIKAVKELQKNYEFYSGDNSESLGQTYTGGNLEQQLKQAIIAATNGKAKFGQYDTVLKQWSYTVNGANNEVKHFVGGLRDTDSQIRAVHVTTKKTESLFDAIKRKTKEVFTYFSGSSIVYRAINELKKGIQYIKEIDAALVELRKVTDETEESYDRFLKTAAKTADRLGSTISAVTEATATFAKLGYSMEMASEMAEAAIVYKNVGDNITSTEDAADSIISTLKGFGLEASESMRIVDRFNEVGNKFAITSQGLGEALRLSASALNEGGNTLDESIGIITAANEVVNDPSSVGTALKTLTLRLRGSKTELEEMGEDVSDMATTTSQLQAKLLALTGGKVDIMLDKNTFKSSTQILREMAAAWEDMTDIQRASALELMGGKLLPRRIEICA